MRARWLLYENIPDVAAEPAAFDLAGRELDAEQTGFALADSGGAVTYPGRDWWDKLRTRERSQREQRAARDAEPPDAPHGIILDTPAQRRRALSRSPRKGEGTIRTARRGETVAQVKQRVQQNARTRARIDKRIATVRSYFGQLGAAKQAETRADTALQWRVTINARARATMTPGQGEEDVGKGVQVSPWQRIPRGGRTPTAIEVRALYLDTVRAATRTDTAGKNRHGPAGQVSDVIPAGLTYEQVVIIPDTVTLEVQL